MPTFKGNERDDLAISLVHFTRERVTFSGDFLEGEMHRIGPFDVLKEILVSGVIRPGWGHVKGKRPVVCLADVPLANLDDFVRNGRYDHYGIILMKGDGFRLGARPVLYLPDAEGGWIPDAERWRHVRYEHDLVDFTHEREWRTLSELRLEELSCFFVLVRSKDEAEQVHELARRFKGYEGALREKEPGT